MSRKNIFAELDREPRRHPYGARIDFFLDEEGIQFSLDGPASLLATDDAIVRLDLAPDQPLGPLKHKKLYRANIEGFATAGEAEAMGLKLSLALLWSAITKFFGMRLEYHSPLPCIVYDRTDSHSGMSTRGHLSSHFPATAADLAELMSEVLASSISVDRQLLLSMELFAAAGLEVSDRAKFLGLVSSLEPLASPRKYPSSVVNLMNSFRAQLRAVDLSETNGGETTGVKTSLDNRLKQLEHESIRQAILRTIREILPGDDSSLKTIDEAYALRSKMLHEGIADPYLDRKTQEVEQVLRRFYAARIGKRLRIGS
jgi:hypothetical protein